MSHDRFFSLITRHSVQPVRVTRERRIIMEQAVQTQKQSAVATHETKWTGDQIELLKNTVCKGATDDEFKIFCYAVQRTGLDPFMKQIHAVKRWNAKANREDMAIQVGIDGFRLVADRTGAYAGNDEPIFDNEVEPNKATVTVYKMVQGVRCAFTASARWSEYYPGDKMGFMWKKMPCVMLGKVAESLALRKAFPADLSGLYTNEEMAQADRDTSQPARAMEAAIKTVEQPKASVSVVGSNPPGRKPSEPQIKRLYAIAHKANISDGRIHGYIKSEFGIESVTALSIPQYNQVCDLMLTNQFPEEATTADLPPFSFPDESQFIGDEEAGNFGMGKQNRGF